jgi:hypothetical protein
VGWVGSVMTRWMVIRFSYGHASLDRDGGVRGWWESVAWIQVDEPTRLLPRWTALMQAIADRDPEEALLWVEWMSWEEVQLPSPHDMDRQPSIKQNIYIYIYIHTGISAYF